MRIKSDNVLENITQCCPRVGPPKLLVESYCWDGHVACPSLLGDPSGFLSIQDVTIVSACAPPGGGRNPVTARFIRHFSMFSLPMPSEHSLKQIFQVRLDSNLGKRGKITYLFQDSHGTVCF